MFFKDQDGAQAVLFGEEKVVIANFQIKNKENNYVGLILGEQTDSQIMTVENLTGKNTKELNAKIRLVFQEIKHVDILIDNLKKIKKVLGNAEISRIIKPDLN